MTIRIETLGSAMAKDIQGIYDNQDILRKTYKD
jgi:hypothetical protein